MIAKCLALSSALLGLVLSNTPSFALEWSTSVIDSGGDVGQYNSLAFDQNGFAHISYFDATNSDIKYASFNGSSWLTSVIDAQASSGETSLAIDSSGRPSVSYRISSSGLGRLNYATFSGTAWQKTTVDSAGNVGLYSSLRLNSSGKPSIAYYDTTNSAAKYAVYSGSSWTVSTIAASGDVGKYTSLALKSDGTPIVSFLDTSNPDHPDLFIASYTGTNWSFKSLTNSISHAGFYTSLELDNSGNPIVAYGSDNSSSAVLKLATADGATWTISTPDATAGSGFAPSLALDQDGNLGISYFEVVGGLLKYAHYNGTSWDISTVDSSSGADGLYNSLAYDALNRPVISYYDGVNQDLKVAILVPEPSIVSLAALSLMAAGFCLRGRRLSERSAAQRSRA